MNARPDLRPDPRRSSARKSLDAWRVAFAEFLSVPALIIVGFLLLAYATFILDRSQADWLTPARLLLQAFVFADTAATASLLGTISAGLITITSITLSLLLISLQQSASALTHQVYDQFLRSWHNQAYFGVFVGLSVYALITLASAGPLNPVFGGAVALVLTILALALLLALFYTTVDQMRPVMIIEAIHNHVLKARQVQLVLIRRTRREAQLAAPVRLGVQTQSHGFVTKIDVDAIEAAATQAEAEVEARIRVTIGEYVVYGQLIAEVTAHTQADAELLASALQDAIHRATKRDLAADPLDGIEELETIGWTGISTAQSDPEAGVLTIYSLRDILARWCVAAAAAPVKVAPVVYQDDVMPKLMNAFESLAVSASESMQHQSLAEILRSFALLFDRLPPTLQARAEDIILRSLSAMGEHVLTNELESALSGLADTLDAAQRPDTAAAVRAAQSQLAASLGKLGNRATRIG